jgi:HAD superfamily hydrolase (TIGR01490 family)
MSDIEGKYRVGAFFDLDMTITCKDSFRYFLEVHYLKKLTNYIYVPWILFYTILRKLRIISLQAFKERALVSFNGKNERFVRQIGKTFTEKHLLSTVRRRALNRICWHRKLGHIIFIITSCPDIYIPFLAEHFKFDGYECSKLAYRNNKFIGKIEGNDCSGSEKTRRIRTIVEHEAIDLSCSYAYSDHESDLPLLELVGKPVAVTPTKQLRRIAVERSWEIEAW